MNVELLFSIGGMLAMLGWLILLASPVIPEWSDKISGLIIPLILSLGYVSVSLLAPSGDGGSFGSLAEVGILFSQPEVLLAGWIHYLAFDLFVGAWICKKAREENIRFWFVIPCLPLTFMLGPAGFLAFSAVRGVITLRKPAA